MRAQPYFTVKKKSRNKPKFEEELRELACDKRVALDGNAKWTVKVECGQWADFKRESVPLHHMHRKLREVSIKLVLEKLEAAIGEPFTVLSCTLGHGLAVLFQEADVFCVLVKDGVTLYSSDAEILDHLVREKVIPQVSQAKSVNLLNAGGGRGIQIQFAGCIDRPLNDLNYAPEVASQIRDVLSWVASSDPFGRIVIFAGPPGTGKSFAVRALVTETENVEWVIVPSHLVSRLAGPDMVQVLLEERGAAEGPLGLIVEDADSLLRERLAGNDENVVSQLLNLGEGLTGDLANIRIILTTNVARLQIDKALLRKGRLYKFVQFNALAPERAAALFKTLTGRDHEFRDPIALSDVYGLANEHDTNVKEPSTDGFGQYA